MSFERALELTKKLWQLSRPNRMHVLFRGTGLVYSRRIWKHQGLKRRRLHSKRLTIPAVHQKKARRGIGWDGAFLTE
jgi:hypothetical protein